MYTIIMVDRLGHTSILEGHNKMDVLKSYQSLSDKVKNNLFSAVLFYGSEKLYPIIWGCMNNQIDRCMHVLVMREWQSGRMSTLRALYLLIKLWFKKG